MAVSFLTMIPRYFLLLRRKIRLARILGIYPISSALRRTSSIRLADIRLEESPLRQLETVDGAIFSAFAISLIVILLTFCLSVDIFIYLS